MSKVRAIWSVVREPWRISVLAGDGVGVGFAVGRGVERGVGFAVGCGVEGRVGVAVGLGVGAGVGLAVGWFVGLGDDVAAAGRVGFGVADTVGPGADGDRLQAGEPVMVGPWVGRDALGDGAGEMEPGAAGPQLTATNAPARISLVIERCRSEDRGVTVTTCPNDTSSMCGRTPTGNGHS
jgi:hypothetical protein